MNVIDQTEKKVKEDIIRWLKKNYEEENNRFFGIAIYEDLMDFLNK